MSNEINKNINSLNKLIDFLSYNGFRYIARDSNNRLSAFVLKPFKGNYCWDDFYKNYDLSGIKIDIPEIQWNDKEPYCL